MANFNLSNLNFFKLYNLKEYRGFATNDFETAVNEKIYSKEDNYMSFVPIEMRTTQFMPSYGETNVDSERDQVVIKLPWRVGEISDSVAVSFSNSSGSTLKQAVLTWAQNLLTGGKYRGAEFVDTTIEEIAKHTLVNYNAENLLKTLSLDFILPLTSININDSMYSEDFMNNTRAYLGALQGLVYPRGFGYLYPKMMAFNFGGMYRGFRGFLSEVTINYSDTMVELGNFTFPMVITGSLKFVNIFKYFWQLSEEGLSPEVLDAFLLDPHPQILFGYESEDNIKTYIRSINNTIGTDRNILNPNININTALRNLFNRSSDISGVELDSDLMSGLSGGLQNLLREQIDNNLLENFDLPLLTSMIDNVSNITNTFTNEQLSFLGIDSSNESVSLVNNIQDTLGTIQTISNYADVLNAIKDHDEFGTLSALTKIVGSSGNALGETLVSVINAYWPTMDILKQVDSGIDLDNVTYLYENILEIIGAVESLPGNQVSDKKVVRESLYASSLQNEKIINTTNSINDKVNDMLQSNNTNMNPLSAIQTANLLLLETEIFKNLEQKSILSKELYEKSYIMKSNNIIDNNTYSKFNKVYEEMDSIDIDQMTAINTVLYNKLFELKGVIESV